MLCKPCCPPWAGLVAAGVTPQMSDIAVQSTRSHREEHARSLPTPASRALEVTAHLQCRHLLSIVPLSYGRAKRPCSEKKGDREHKTICISEAVGDQNFHSRPPRSGCNAMPMETSLCAAGQPCSRLSGAPAVALRFTNLRPGLMSIWKDQRKKPWLVCQDVH